MSLKDAKKNVPYKIVGYTGQFDATLRRFLELGFSVGEKVKVLRSSLGNKVVLIEIRGYLLSVRKSLLCKIEVE